MLELIGLSPHHDVGAVNFAFVVILLLSAYKDFKYSFRDTMARPWQWQYWAQMFDSRPEFDVVRGFGSSGMVMAGFTLRIGFWTPWRSMKIACEYDNELYGCILRDWWSYNAWVFSYLGLLLAYAGLVAKWSPAIDRWFGGSRWAPAFVFLLMVLLTGAIGTEMLSRDLELFFFWAVPYRWGS